MREKRRLDMCFTKLLYFYHCPLVVLSTHCSWATFIRLRVPHLFFSLVCCSCRSCLSSFLSSFSLSVSCRYYWHYRNYHRYHGYHWHYWHHTSGQQRRHYKPAHNWYDDQGACEERERE